MDQLSTHSNGYQLTPTWCPRHCGVIDNEMTDDHAQYRAVIEPPLFLGHNSAAK